MATSFFDDKAHMPNDAMVDAVLSDTKPLWDDIKTYVAEHFPGLGQSWKFYSKKAGWSLVFKAKDRALFYFIPCDGYFKISLVFGEKAIRTAEQSSIPDSMKQAIAAAPKYAEGASFFMEVKEKLDVEPVRTLLKIKDES